MCSDHAREAPRRMFHPHVPPAVSLATERLHPDADTFMAFADDLAQHSVAMAKYI